MSMMFKLLQENNPEVKMNESELIFQLSAFTLLVLMSIFYKPIKKIMNKYATYFAVEKKLKNQGFDVDRSELVQQFTHGKKTGLKELTDWEFKEFCNWMNQVLPNKSEVDRSRDWQNSPENKMRRKVFVLFVSKMGYSKNEFYNWVKKYGKFHKELKDHSLEELTQLVTQAEKVYKSYLTEIDK